MSFTQASVKINPRTMGRSETQESAPLKALPGDRLQQVEPIDDPAEPPLIIDHWQDFAFCARIACMANSTLTHQAIHTNINFNAPMVRTTTSNPWHVT